MTPPSASLIAIPPLTASLAGGVGAGMIAWSFAYPAPDVFVTAVRWSGFGVVIGFAFGSLIWADKIGGGQQQPKPTRTYASETTIRVRQVDGLAGDNVTLPADLDRLRAFAARAISTEPPHYLPASDYSDLFTRKRFERLRRRMMDWGWARWFRADWHQGGVVLTRVGASVMDKIAAGYQLPLLGGMQSAWV